MVQNRDLSEPLFLIHHGVSEAKAFSLSPRHRLAWCIAMGMHAGGKWDWSAMDWKSE